MFLLNEPPAIAQPASEQAARVTIAIRGSTPPFDPGFLMAVVLVIGIDEAGEAKAYFIPGGPGSTPLPAVGAHCELHYAPGQLDFVGGLTGEQLSPPNLMKAPVVSRFDCDATSPV
jgi:hypothetical protein